jgi:nitrile hydratase accessory protein
MSAYERRRNLVLRSDGRLVNVARPRGQLFVCATGCCCGRVDDGFAPVPTALFHDEWERRRLRNRVHLTIGGCLGPCALANVVLLLFDGQALWFHSVNADALVLALYDHVERMLDAGAPLPPPPALVPYHFTASAWQPRPDGQPLDDQRPSRAATDGKACLSTAEIVDTPEEASIREGLERSCRVEHLLDRLDGGAAVPRRNGELVFEEPWQGRVFGMTLALSERGLFAWEEFRQELIRQIAAAERQGGPFRYYEAWLAAFESIVATRGILTRREIEEMTFQFEFGERDDIF